MMNKEKKYAIAKLWVAGAILMALCLVTDLYAQEPVVTAAPVAEVAAETTDAIASRRFQARWEATLQTGDPYYNPNFTTDGEGFRLACR